MVDKNKISWQPSVVEQNPILKPMNFEDNPASLFTKKVLNSVKEMNKPKLKTVEELYTGWHSVMQVEAQNHLPSFNPDPNISKEFFNKIEKIASKLNTNAEDLCAIMYKESHFDPKVKSSDGKYCGLIQIDEETFNNIFKDSKISYSQYCKLPREKQLDFVEGYLTYRIEHANLKGKKLSGKQIYALIHRPKDINDKQELKERQQKIDKAKRIFEKFRPKIFNT